jgi:hypothetical protein
VPSFLLDKHEIYAYRKFSQGEMIMKTEDAIAVYLHLGYRVRNSREQRAYFAASEVIAQIAKKFVETVPPKQGDFE